MYKNFNETYHFIDKFKEDDLIKLHNKISLIYRNYEKKININIIKKIKDFCKRTNRKFYLANEIKLAVSLNLDGAYIPSFNKDFRHNSYITKTNFKLIGSAHNLNEIRIKDCKLVKTRQKHSFYSKSKKNQRKTLKKPIKSLKITNFPKMKSF